MKAEPVERIEAGYLPDIAAADVAWQTLVFDTRGRRLEVAVPSLSPGQMQALARRVRAGAERRLRTMTVAQIIDVIDRAIARWLDRSDPARRRAETWLPIVTGFDGEMVRQGLGDLLRCFRAPQLRRFVAEDFANPLVLDGFQPTAKGGAVRAFGPGLLVHNWAGNVPALPVWSTVCGLLVKAGSIGKLPSAEPLFAGWFARLLVEVHPPLADCLAVVWWPGGGGDEASALYAEADAVLAYGGNEALDAIRRRLPVTTRFLPHGHRLGVGLIGREALDPLKAPALARLAAWDVARYEQQGCYSPQVFYVERGAAVSPRAFADYLAAELANLEQRFPRRPLALEEGAALARWQQAMSWQMAGRMAEHTAARPTGRTDGRLAGSSVPEEAQAMIGPQSAAWRVAFSEAVTGIPIDDSDEGSFERLPPLEPTALYRTIRVIGVRSLDAVMPVLAARQAYLQTAGVAADPARLVHLAEALGAAGVTRISAIGSMGAPEAGWHHDGRFNLLDLVRMTEIEQSAETAAESFARYAD